MNKIKIDYNKLKQICLAPESKWLGEGNYYFKNNGAKILAVAHLDYVCDDGKPDFVKYKYKGSTFVMSETLDDRLGVFIITELLPQLGIVTDILLTTDEEIGRSTGQLFEEKTDYNWMFSFDRRSRDIVSYMYEDDELRKLLMNSIGGFFNQGSYSDISSMQHLKIKGLNFGAGYHNEHSPECYATEREILIGVNQFIRWYRKYKDTHLPHTPTMYGGAKKQAWKYDYGQGYDDYGWYGRGNKNVYLTESREIEDEKGYDLTEDDEVVFGTCDNCDTESLVYYHNKWDAWLCNDCYETYDRGDWDTIAIRSNEVEKCQLCGTTETDATSMGGTMDWVEMSNGKSVLVCDICGDYLSKHYGNREFEDTIQVKY